MDIDERRGRDPNGWMITHTGRQFWPLEPRIEEIDIGDIAHSLAFQSRFNGHAMVFLSVAEHCVQISRMVRADQAMWGLMHDAAEAYLGDVVRPLKRRMKFLIASENFGGSRTFHDVEMDLLRLIAERFGMAWPIPAEVLAADDRMLATERRHLFASLPEWPSIDDIEPYEGLSLESWSPWQAERAFIDRVEELTHG